MSNPNKDYAQRTFSGEACFTVTIQCDDLEGLDREDVLTELRRSIETTLRELREVDLGTCDVPTVQYEDDDLAEYEEEDFMSRADRLYEQANDK